MNRPNRRGDSKNSRPKQKAEKELAVTCYQDEAVFQQAGTTIRTCARVGIGIQLLNPPVRKSIKVMGAARIGADAITRDGDKKKALQSLCLSISGDDVLRVTDNDAVR